MSTRPVVRIFFRGACQVSPRRRSINQALTCSLQRRSLFFSSSPPPQCRRRGGLLRSRTGQMKRNGGGPAARRGDVSTEGKQLFVCLSVTLGLPFISLQGSGAVFTPGAALSLSLSSCVSLPFSPCLHPRPETTFLRRECQKVFHTQKSLCTWR